MAAFAGEVSVFVDTDLGTRIAMNVPQDITAGAFKRDFERVHFTCLPNSGEIQVNGLMVKRKSCFYYLPDSLPIKYVFHGMRSTWFLRVEASPLKNLCISRLCHDAVTTLLESQVHLINYNDKDKARGNSEDKTIHISKKKKKRKKYNEKYLQNTASAMPEGCSCKFEENPTGTNNKNQVVMPESEVQNSVKPNANLTQGSLSEMSAEVISVTGIINKYFPSLNGIDNSGSPSLSDVTSRAVDKEIADQPKTPKTPPNVLRAPLHVDLVSKTSRYKRRESKLRKRHLISETSGDKRRESKLRKHYLVSETSGDKRGESKLRKRFLVASQSLGICTNKHSPLTSLSGFKDGKLSQHKTQTIGSLFEISDSDD